MGRMIWVENFMSSFTHTNQLSFGAAENPRSAYTESCDHLVAAMRLLRLLPRE